MYTVGAYKLILVVDVTLVDAAPELTLIAPVEVRYKPVALGAP
jgi:hypothetical protein